MQFRDLKKQYEALKPEIDASIQSVLDNSNYILGKQVTELENTLANYVGRKYCITCASGTDALVLSLMSKDIGQGDAVFVPDFTYIASASCASLVGATPIFVDIDLKTFNMRADALENAVQNVIKEGKLTPKVVIPVDLFGLPADYMSIKDVAEKYNLFVLEDAAQGFGGNIDGKMACSLGNMSTTSFFPAKPLGCYGDGGAIFTDDEIVNERLRSIRAGGKSPLDKYDNREIGTNSRLDTIQAAILLTKFKAFKEYELEHVNEVATWYTDRLNDYTITPTIPAGFYSSWAQYTIKLKNKEERDKLQRELRKFDIPSMVYYPRGMHQQQAFKDRLIDDNLYKNTCEVVDEVLSLPMHPYLDEKMVDNICKNVIDILK